MKRPESSSQRPSKTCAGDGTATGCERILPVNEIELILELEATGCERILPVNEIELSLLGRKFVSK